MDGPETSETKVEDKGEPEEAAAEIEAGRRQKEIADETISKMCVETEREAQTHDDSGNKKQS